MLGIIHIVECILYVFFYWSTDFLVALAVIVLSMKRCLCYIVDAHDVHFCIINHAECNLQHIHIFVLHTIYIHIYIYLFIYI